jgi:hypothetical protein
VASPQKVEKRKKVDFQGDECDENQLEEKYGKNWSII